MKKIDSNRTEYQEFLFSLFKRFGIDSPDESWSDKEWKDIVNSRLTNNHNRANFYRELEEFNVKNPSDEIWSYKSDEKLDEIKPKVNKEDEVNPKVTKEEEIKPKVTKEEEIKPKVNKEDKLKKCPYCAEEIKQEAIKCRFCKSVLNNEEEDKLKKCPYCAEEIKDKAMKCPHCHEILIKRKPKPKPKPQSKIIIKAKKKTWYWKYNKVDLYLDGKFASEIGRKADLKYNVFNGKHKIHLVASRQKIKKRDSSTIDDRIMEWMISTGQGTDEDRGWVEWTKSNKIEIEILNSNLNFDWGMNSFAGIKSEGLWIKQI